MNKDFPHTFLFGILINDNKLPLSMYNSTVLKMKTWNVPHFYVELCGTGNLLFIRFLLSHLEFLSLSSICPPFFSRYFIIIIISVTKKLSKHVTNIYPQRYLLPVLSFDMLLIQRKISISAVIPMIIILFLYNSTE